MDRSALRLTAAILVLAVLASTPLFLRAQAPGPDMSIDAATRMTVIDGTLKALNDYYVFPDVAAKMAQNIRTRQARQEYESVSSARTLAVTLTTHLREVSQDKHLAVVYSASVLPRFPPPPPTPEQI